jgi:hypothetical protein
MTALCLLVQLALHLLPNDALARTREEIRDAIKAQASQRHPRPAPDFWESLGPEALPVLKAMIEEDPGFIERTWLIDGLGHFNDPGVGRILEEKIKTSGNEVLTKKMLSALIHSQGDQAFEFVEPYLENADPHIRIAVARGIRNYMTSGRAKDRLSTYLANEKQSWIKGSIASAGSEGREQGGIRAVREPPSAPAEAAAAKPALEQPAAALSEKEREGEWKGVYLTPSTSGSAKGFLKKEKDGWRVEILLPKKKRIELKAGEAEVFYDQTDHAHWIRVKSKKTDTVFTGSRKAN